jgi:1,2-diacylglycerol-3-alpha-glucose alpha-1,2-glucosyltransferase
MKICVYLEFYNFLGGLLFKKIGTGLLSSYKNQKAILDRLGIPYTDQWDGSCDILQINTPWFKSVYLMKKARRAGKKVIVWSHVTVEDSLQVFRFMKIVAPLFKKYLTYAYGLADLIFSPTEYTKSLLTAYGLPEEKIVVQSNAVNLKKYYEDDGQRKAGKTKYELNTLTVGNMGLVVPRKGVDTFLMLAKQHPGNQFIWFGKIYSSLLVKPLPKSVPQNVQFTGYIADGNEAYNSMDIFIFPSYEENEGMVILEAAAAGLPILVRDIPVFNGWLKHGVNCLKAKNDQEFDKYLDQLINDMELRKRLGQNAKLLAQEKSTQVLAVKYRRELDSLLQGREEG